MTHDSIRETVAAIAAGNASSLELLEAVRAQAEAGVALNAIAAVDWKSAERRAAELDALARAGRRRPLLGIPVSIKDLFNVEGMPAKGGTRAKLPDLGPAEAELVRRLRDAGALIFAKTNMHEIALGATGENMWTGDVCNPHDPAHQAGGSSSGAAVAIATGVGLGAVGSDTGGSVRIPAAFCGVTGFKPSFGAIPLAGGLYLSWTCDHAGPLARSVDDCALLYEVMASRSAAHGTVPRVPRIGVPVRWLAGRLDAGVRDRFERLLSMLREDGCELRELDPPRLPDAWGCYTPIVRAEAAWVHRAALADGGEGFSPMVLPALQSGMQIGAQAYIDALKTRAEVAADLDAALRGVDAMLLPTSPVAAPLRGQSEVNVEGGRMSVREAVLGQTLAFSMCGVPALSLPFDRIGKLPLGLQVVGRRDSDASVLALGRWLERAIASAGG